ncbi:Asp-tRNA(Asn)/Glu-tRNA(Gln) amidotransferase subunit GatB [Neoehrlichia mikurensis]|uniref:Aspartyl/glutamyl-tRNA(Asn/Gln) amidotransferase subunit B n=2 Tax=Neoehrlichia mikurensis TaxID=89586 RepID=A0A9Q9BXG3_9RICK|nr:Asp-tRNA(Asn)/Glu-tRNA(Gln) amidotransferase subunit GatB [Neoehrlichia mikurensis]QXK92089.1 Asp-tRNA(Asn)/Glu-tRNA(Gln) amidotransferase subunit GatB [Neoehrlichia mikurensis]QXK92546.1 Asp-tRNA(Asn)/Glu-tRNA(Gln) amidotransferase subunit GatB [Neoehrlichia mikurensis]QXK93782.1 Asp-tRNA(Asn)/Glu-tRNA(Gln) amidotransferase subunit GatB [Neoehrlichia mikurensis]UTO55243.1 Asp-tRNA(Asn)/Glu-tRNA(Gln) amidotransferase subunit GatB [Neoehrlichia mikurensis]UTO56163.1 Asp-tRNA(Asn)/Glu-tRNA(Gl
MVIQGKNCNWEVIIGLEVHAQIISNSKLFSGASTKFCEEPNIQVSLFDMAMPGMLPVVNTYCIEQVVKAGLALSCEINKYSVFDRKNYFYPDLPLGYQITQFYYPIVSNGKIVLEESAKKEIRISRIHLEQDAGKSIHEKNNTYIDFNRAGVALMEIVSEPDLRSPEEVAEYLKKLRMILRFINCCDGDMEKGSLRCDANVSVRPVGDKNFGTRSEIKNLNSIRYVMQAIEYESNRQIEILDCGGILTQSTMLFDVNSGQTRVIRDKEDAHDYRYFPDPDLLPITLTSEFIDSLKLSLPELPDAKKARYIKNFGLSLYDAEILSSDKDTAEYFEKVVAEEQNFKLAASWIIGELFGKLNKANIPIKLSPIKAEDLVKLLLLMSNDVISGKIAKQVFNVMFDTGKEPLLIIEEQGLQEIKNEDMLACIIDNVLKNNADKVNDYKQGKDKLFGYFVGQVMKETNGKANPQLVNSLLKKKLI